MVNKKATRLFLVSAITILWATSATASEKDPNSADALGVPICPPGWKPKEIKRTRQGEQPEAAEVSCEKKEENRPDLEFALPFILELHHQSTPTYRWIAGPPPEEGGTSFTLERNAARLNPGVVIAPSIRYNITKQGTPVWVAGGLGVSLESLGATGLGERLTGRASVGWSYFTLSFGLGRAVSTELASREVAGLSGRMIVAKKEELPELVRANDRVWTRSIGIGVDLAAASEGLSKTFAFLTGVIVGK